MIDRQRALVIARVSAKRMRGELRMRALWQSQLTALEREVIRRVRERPPVPAGRAAGDEPPLGSTPLPDPIDSYLPPTKEFSDRARRMHREVFRNLVEEFGGDVIGEIGTHLAFDPGTPNVLRMFAHDDQQIERSVMKLLDDVRDTLEEGMNQGETLADVAKRIRATVAAEAKTPERGGTYVRAERIARTEAHTATGFARFEAFDQAGVEEHEWSTSHDEFVRDSHDDMEGETVVVGEPFSNGCKFPGDPAGGPSESINCRCINLPKVGAMAEAA